MLDKALAHTRILYAVYAALSLVSMILIHNALMVHSAGLSGKMPIALAALTLVFPLVLFIALLPRWKEAPEKVFLLVATPTLLAFAFLMLIGQTPDEVLHIQRALTLGQTGGDMIVPSCILRESFPQTYGELASTIGTSLPLDDVTTSGANMSAYLPHLYILPAIAMKACCALGMNLYAALYVGRLVNVALFLIAGYWIIRLMPLARVFTMVYLLNPMMLQQQASLSADAMTNITTLLFITFVLYARFSERISKKIIIGIAIAFVFMALSKYLYALLAYLLLLLVPRIEQKGRRIAIYVAAAALAVIAVLCVMFVLPIASLQSTVELMKNPVECARVLGNTFILIAPQWVQMFFGLVLGSLNIPVWQPIAWAYAIVLILSLIFNLGETLEFKRAEKIAITALAVCVTAAMALVFRDWAIRYDGNYDYITGVQGRYFLPYLNVALMCCSSPRASLVRKNCLIVYAILLMLFVACDMTYVADFFI